MQKWEYKYIIKAMEEEELNSLGELGWEVAAVAGDFTAFIFKRPKL